MKDLVYWIWLSLSVTPGNEVFKKLIDKLIEPSAVFEADEDDIASIIGSRSKDLSALCDKDLSRATEILDFCESKGVGILTYADEKFPEALREIDSPPVLLYYRGQLPDFKRSCLVSIVGTRRLTDYGRRNAFVIGHDLAVAGATVVSGMAVGIDGVSHAGSLSAGGVNVAFLGSGIDVCYPIEHKRLAREIVKNGCVMTEYAPGTRPEKYNFPRRNRLIAGIASAAIVIEGRERSGAIITARYAKKYGKTVYGLPGNVDNKTSEVSNLLIKNGAKLITAPDDVIADLEFVYPGIINPFKLKNKLDVDMYEVLREYSVACVTPSDDIFPSNSRRRRKREDKESKNEDQGIKLSENETIATVTEPSIEEFGFDKDALEIYKRIPADGDCLIEELAFGEYKLQKVMKALLKLEMGRFVVMLPGERVKRNLR